MGGEHGHGGHADEQGQGQAVQGTLHPWKAREEGPQGGFVGGVPPDPPPLRGSEVTGVAQVDTVTTSCVTLGQS